MERVLLLALVGCGFEHGRLSTQPPIDARIADTTIADVPIDVAIDAGWTVAMCPSSYMAYGTPSSPTSSRYRLNTTAKTFWGHYDDCADDLSGKTHLVGVDTVDEAMAIMTVIDATNGLPNVGPWVLPWSGGLQLRNQAANNAGWISITGGPMFAGAWAGGEPNDSGGDSLENNQENHVAFFRGQTYLCDIAGTYEFAAVCECDGLPIAGPFSTEVEATRP